MPVISVLLPFPIEGLRGVVCPHCVRAGLPSALSLCSRGRMAAVPPCHGTARETRAAGAELGMQDWALPGALGTRSGMFRCQGCAPACCHHCGLKDSHVTSHSQGSCLVPRAQLALPSSPHFPGELLSRNPFCLESSQVFFLLQSCSNCPKAPGSWIARSTKGSTWSTTEKPSSTITPFLLLTSGPCCGLQRPETKLVCGSCGRAAPSPHFLHRGEPTSPLGRCQCHLAQPCCLPHRFSQGQSCLWEGAATLQSTWAGGALLHSAFLLGSVAGEEG